MDREPLVPPTTSVPLAAWLSQEPVSIAVSGHSMEPFLKEGDRLQVARSRPDDFVIGDLIVFMRTKELVVHRLVALRPNKFLEMGDAQERGNWHAWPQDVGRAVSAPRAKGGGLDLCAVSYRLAASRRARLMRLRHATSLISELFPDGLLRRAFRRLARPVLRPSSPVPGFDAESVKREE